MKCIKQNKIVLPDSLLCKIVFTDRQKSRTPGKQLECCNKIQQTFRQKFTHSQFDTKKFIYCGQTNRNLGVNLVVNYKNNHNKLSKRSILWQALKWQVSNAASILCNRFNTCIHRVCSAVSAHSLQRHELLNSAEPNLY